MTAATKRSASLKVVGATSPGRLSSQEVIAQEAANELIFGVVGHVGSGTSETARHLREQLERPKGGHLAFETEILKATGQITAWAEAKGYPLKGRTKGRLEPVEQLQALGDRMRSEEGDTAIVARRLILEIRRLRAAKTGARVSPEQPVQPDQRRRAWILDSLRHPDEVELLRHIYQDAFVLVGVVCLAEKREERLSDKYKVDGALARIRAFMDRDADEGIAHGQRVAATFHLADFFVDNTEDRLLHPGEKSNPAWTVADQLGRLTTILTHSEIARPTPAETAMHAAYGAQLRSACLSRQVGAALTDATGTLISTGTNEVPRAGGGLYASGAGNQHADERCAYRADGLRFCSNTTEQLVIINELEADINGTLQRLFGEALTAGSEQWNVELRSCLKRSRIGNLLEFSRAVHAEMEALLAAGRAGRSTVGCNLYVTTFPCHYCARHIVAAGISEVQYIEPYPKSMALRLHDDSIATSQPDAGQPQKVVFKPFTGVSPRLYRRAFFKDRSLKDTDGRMQFAAPEWGTAWHLRRVSYTMLEAKLAEAEVNDGNETA